MASQLKTHYHCIGPVNKLFIRRHMIGMAMGMGDNQFFIISAIGCQDTIHHMPQWERFFIRGCTRIYQQGLLIAHQQKNKGSLVVNAFILPKDPGVGVVPDYLNERVAIGFAIRGSMNPGLLVKINRGSGMRPYSNNKN